MKMIFVIGLLLVSAGMVAQSTPIIKDSLSKSNGYKLGPKSLLNQSQLPKLASVALASPSVENNFILKESSKKVKNLKSIVMPIYSGQSDDKMKVAIPDTLPTQHIKVFTPGDN